MLFSVSWSLGGLLNTSDREKLNENMKETMNMPEMKSIKFKFLKLFKEKNENVKIDDFMNERDLFPPNDQLIHDFFVEVRLKRNILYDFHLN